ncbi:MULTISPECIES: hypothetical protein [unclassified Lactobacillus]|uniref:hypothetical protein n=1 Tax=unclassified Lactobacillus TaxID=2620435 RepID=UPI0018F33967|nr:MULTISPECIES: hypothetical protein [unclassified Lactobacillus]
MSLEYGLYSSEADLDSLQEFFPDTNIRKLYEVENHHRKLAQILDDQFETEKQEVQSDIRDLEDQKRSVDEQIKELGFVGNISKEFLDKHSEIKRVIDALKTQNESYLTLKDLKDAKKYADNQLRKVTEKIISDIQNTINDRMAEYNSTLYAIEHKPPVLKINAYNRL